MRLIGQLREQEHAKCFGDFLYAQGIESRIDPGKAGDWEIWVLDEQRVGEATAQLERFAQTPDDPSFAESAREGARRREQDSVEAVPKRARVVEARTMSYRPPIGMGGLTMVLMAISILVTALMFANKDLHIKQLFQISNLARPPILPEIRHGEIWRIITPIFIHYDILHILFNMLWLRDLGSMIEARKGTWTLLVMVLVMAATSNLGQYWQTGPNFGGMSGVVYGLLGYVWMQGRYNPSAGLALHPQTVTMMIIWYVLCLTGLLGPIANTAHTVGAVVGIAWGFIAAKLATSR